MQQPAPVSEALSWLLLCLHREDSGIPILPGPAGWRSRRSPSLQTQAPCSSHPEGPLSGAPHLAPHCSPLTLVSADVTTTWQHSLHSPRQLALGQAVPPVKHSPRSPGPGPEGRSGITFPATVACSLSSDPSSPGPQGYTELFLAKKLKQPTFTKHYLLPWALLGTLRMIS